MSFERKRKNTNKKEDESKKPLLPEIKSVSSFQRIIIEKCPLGLLWHSEEKAILKVNITVSKEISMKEKKKNSKKPEVTFRPLLSGMFNPIMWPNLLPDCFIPFLSFFSYASPPIFSYFPPRSLLPSSFSVPSSPFLCYFWSKCCSGDLRWAAHIGKTLWGGCIE